MATDPKRKMNPLALLTSLALFAGAACSPAADASAPTAPPGPPSEPSTHVTQPPPSDAGRSVTGPSDPAEAASRAATLAEELHYFDGPLRRSAWLSPDEVIEFQPSEAGEAALRGADSGAVVLATRGAGARRWRLSAGARPSVLCEQLAAQTPDLCLSPVLHDGRSARSAVRALPGGLLVSLEPTWTEAQVQAWMTARDLRIESELVAPPRTYRVGAAPGLASLELANALHARTDVVSATPDFWMQSTTR